jgi:hypothetical protein
MKTDGAQSADVRGRDRIARPTGWTSGLPRARLPDQRRPDQRRPPLALATHGGAVPVACSKHVVLWLVHASNGGCLRRFAR